MLKTVISDGLEKLTRNKMIIIFYIYICMYIYIYIYKIYTL